MKFKGYRKSESKLVNLLWLLSEIVSGLLGYRTVRLEGVGRQKNMSQYSSKSFWVLLVLAFGACGNVTAEGVKEIGTLEELADCAGKSGQIVRMASGVYSLSDLLTEKGIEDRVQEAAERAERSVSKRHEAAMILFSGSDNSFDLSDVVIEVDTTFLSAFEDCYTVELMLTGNRNVVKGLTLRDVGNEPTKRGGVSLAVYGDNVTLSGVSLHVRGSAPYGYGDLLGKGKNSVVKLGKHSGLLVCGDNTRLIGCGVINQSFGHCFFIQGGSNTYFENCYAEGEMRSTDDMLSETSGVAFENGFKTVYRPNIIQPGYMKSLNECGFRTYGQGGPRKRKTGKVTLLNCTAKNVRVGFALAANHQTDPVDIGGCEAIGCERGYYLEKASVVDSRGDAKYGPLIYLVGDEPSVIELTLTSDTSDRIVHAVATISGKGHEIVLDGDRPLEHPIMIGYKPPSAGEISLPIPEASAEGVQFFNHTSMPIMVSELAKECIVYSNTNIQSSGIDMKFIRNAKVGSSL
ncbi:hypothetical protein MLD52_02380 [Puniceicoccaceae bacterium K14]|nr:hypothetical protein [Puniceicoccaceae bacterium K14]